MGLDIFRIKLKAQIIVELRFVNFVSLKVTKREIPTNVRLQLEAFVQSLFFRILAFALLLLLDHTK